MNMFRSTIAPAKREAKAATTTIVQNVSAIVAATRAWTRGSSPRASAARRRRAASGTMPTYRSSSATCQNA
jgi:hypothetical protein